MTEIDFQENWFSAPHKTSTTPTQALWEKHLLPVKDDIRSYLEIGVCEGHSMRWIVENLEPEFAVGVDPWIAPRNSQREAFAKYKENAKRNLAAHIDSGVVQLFETTSQKFMCRQLIQDNPPQFDLVYIDGDHRGAEALLDILLAFWLLSPTGRIVIDDLQRSWHRNRPLVYWSFIFAELILKDRVQREWMEGRQVCLRRLETNQEKRKRDRG